MQCISPINIRDPAFPEDSKRYIEVPCGRCYACLANRRTEWTYRLLQETKAAYSAKFITLTYDDAFVPMNDDGELVLCQRDMQLWLKRFRKLISPYKIRYFYVGEYGGKFRRPHYHILIFNYPVCSRDLFDDLTHTWDKGFFQVGDVNQGSIHYVTKYVIGRLDRDKYPVPPFMRCSLRPAIGSQWLTDEMKEFVSRDHGTVVPMPGGYKCSMPRYYRNKIYTDEVQKEHVKAKNISFASVLRAETDAHDEEYRQSFACGDSLPNYSNMVKLDLIRKGQKLLKDLQND